MKNASKIVCLLSCALLAGAFVINGANVVKGAGGAVINISTPLHITRLKGLFLGNNEDAAWISAGSKNIDVKDGLIVHDGSASIGADAQLVSIGGGNLNTVAVDVLNSGIVGGNSNALSADNSAIGGGQQNSVSGEDGNSVVAGGWVNRAGDGGVVLGGYDNTVSSNGTVVLGGESNVSAGENSLIIGKNARGSDYSFSWNDGGSETVVSNRSARIDAANGLLIGTYNKRDGINVLVNGSAQIGARTINTDFVSGEIMEKNGCFYAYDGEKWHILGKDSTVVGNDGKTPCDGTDPDFLSTISKPCQFGGTLLQHGDKVTGYSRSYAIDCEEFKNENVECKGGQLVVGDTPTEYTYSYCYNISAAPTVDPSLLPEEVPEVPTASATLRGNNSDMNDFTWEELTIGDYTIMDRNLGATAAWNGTDIATASSDFIGYHYQWGNNYGFDPNKTPSTSWTRGNRTDEGYIIFVKSNPWYINATESDEWAQGPCPDGWHIPTKDEWAGIVNAWRVENPTDYGGSERGSKFGKALKLPFAGYRNYNDAGVFSVGTFTDYWSSSTQDDENSYTLGLGKSYVDPEYVFRRSNAFPVRCFKD